MALISLKNVTLGFGGQPLLDGVTLNVERGDRICLLGVNGAGKSSMLRVLSGDIPCDEGEIAIASGVRISRLPQQVPSHLHGSVFDIVYPDHLDDTEDSLHGEAEQIISRLDLDPVADFATLSGGTRRRVLLAKALLGSPDLVLLDEPTNHLDVDSIAWLETFLLRYCRTFLFVTHDRSFLRRLATRIIELDRGHLRDWTCNYDTFLERKEASLEAEAKEWATQDKKLAQEEAWLRRGVKARRTRNEGRVRDLLKLRDERRSRRERVGSVQMSIQEAEQSGRIVLKAQNLSFGYGNHLLFRNLNTVIGRGDRIGILGPNGCGKTTLLKLLLDPITATSDIRPVSGSIIHGTNLQVGYADQLRDKLDDSATLIETIAQDREFVTIEGTQRHVIGYLQDFLFAPDRARQPVGSLSGGERNRLLLAYLFAQPSNVLVLDEPTNDLDLDTLDLLEEQLALYRGTVLVVSHDRTFLNHVVTSTLVFEKVSLDDPQTCLSPDDGWFINEYAGGYDDWVLRRLQPPAVAAASKPSPRSVAETPRAAKPRTRRLWDSERRELEKLPGHIEALESEQAQWHARIADPAFYRENAQQEIDRAKMRLAEIEAELTTAYARWETLEARVAETT